MSLPRAGVGVNPGRNAIRVDERNVQLSPWMAVIAQIKTGRRRVIEYFGNPLIGTTTESLRER